MTLLAKLTPQQEAELGDRAKQLLNDPAFNRAVAEVAKMYWDAWRATAPADTATRELLYQKAHCLDDVVVALSKVLGDGKVSAETLKRAKVQPIR